MVALLTRMGTWILGESIFALRCLSGLAGAFIVLLSAHVARLLGGGSFARSLAALLICFASAFPALCSFFSVNSIDVMVCTLFLVTFLRTLEEPAAHRWIASGVLFGAGLLNKYTFLVLGLSLLVALIATRRWSVLKSPSLYASGAVAALIFLPHLLWQVCHDWPTLDFIRGAMEHRNLSLSPFALLGQLTIALNPTTLPIWLSGFVYLLASKHTEERRFLGWTAAIFVVIYLVLNSKFYYLLPVLPLALLAGAVLLERLLNNSLRRWPRWAVVPVLALSGTTLMPLAVPILPWSSLSGIPRHSVWER